MAADPRRAGADAAPQIGKMDPHPAPVAVVPRLRARTRNAGLYERGGDTTMNVVQRLDMAAYTGRPQLAVNRAGGAVSTAEAQKRARIAIIVVPYVEIHRLKIALSDSELPPIRR